VSAPTPSAGLAGPAGLAGRLRIARRLPLVVALLLGGLATVLLLFPLVGPAWRRGAIRRWSAMLVAACGVAVRVRAHPGALPLESLAPGSFLVANHISWIDIFIIDGRCPASFVAKAEIADWPLVGTLVSRTGNLFIERGRRHAVHRMIERLVHALTAGARVAVFPEGTTSDGRELLPFHANLIQSAIAAEVPVQPMSLKFVDARSGEMTLAPCYIGDDTLVGSVWRTLKAPPITAVVCFGEPQAAEGRDRRQWASDLRAAVIALRDQRSNQD